MVQKVVLDPRGTQTKNVVVLPSSAFLGRKNTMLVGVPMGGKIVKGQIVIEAEGIEKRHVDMWACLGNDISDDQQDIQHGKGMADALFQGAQTWEPNMAS